MAVKLFALVAALALVAANASPLVSDATHFDKVSEMIQDAQADNYGKAGLEAETMPAWETPAWMGRRTNGTAPVQLSSTLAITGTFDSSYSNSDGNTAGSVTYLFFSCIYLKTLSFTTCPSGDQSVVAAIPTISAYSQSVSGLSRRGTVSVAGTMTTTKFTTSAAASSAAQAAAGLSATDLANYATAATAAANSNTAGTTVAAATVTGTAVSGISSSGGASPTPTPTAAAGRTTTFGIAALIAAMFAQLF